jgi:sugar lactone lactonase YvrE
MEFAMIQFASKRAVALALAIPFAGCAAQNSAALPNAVSSLAQASRRIAPASVGAFLYVLNDAGSSSSSSSSSAGSLNEYRSGRPRLLNSITNGISAPRALAFDGKGNVYVVNDAGSSSSWWGSGGSVSVYVAHGTQLLHTITHGLNEPVADAIDGSGNLYVANSAGSSSSSSSSGSAGSVTVYRSGHFRLIDTITDGIFGPRALAFDGSGNLYVLNGGSMSSSSSSSSSSAGSVTIYAHHRLVGTLTNGITAPVAMAVDSAGDVMVANAASSSSSSSSGSGGSVVVFTAGGTTPSETITTGILNVRALALDTSDNLYVANAAGGSSSSSSSSSSASGSVAIFSPGSATPSVTITDGVTNPDALAVAPNGWLYVSNAPGGSSSSSSSSSGGDISVYPAGHTNVRFTITRGISVPVALGIN